MTTLKKLAKSSALGLALGLAVAAPQAGGAQTLRLVQSGSSALTGDFRAGANYRPGAISQIIEQNPVGGYKSLTDTNEGVLRAINVVLQDDTGLTETVGDAQIRYIDRGAGDVRVVILLRSDSGLGVRNVANNARITSFGTISVPTEVTPGGTNNDPDAPLTSITSNGGDLAARLQALAAQPGGIPIQVGLSDVSADTIARFAIVPAANTASPGAFPTSGAGRILRANLAGLAENSFDVGVISLLVIFNSNQDAGDGINITRTGLLNAIGGTTPTVTWGKLDPNPAAPANAARAFFREAPSGTRLTFLLDTIQALGFVENRFNGVTGGVAVGTGNITNAVNANANAISYTFITGAAGLSRPAVRVARYNGVEAFANPGPNPSPGLPQPFGGAAVAGSPTYGDANLYVNTTNGNYELWTFAKLYRKPNADANNVLVSDSLISLLTDPANANIVHRSGLIQPGEMLVTRSGFTSNISGEFTNDGGLIIDLNSPQIEAGLRQ